MNELYHTMQLLLGVTSKVCTKCGIEKPFEAFCREKHGKYGRRGDCTKCVIDRRKERLLHPLPPKPVPSRLGYKFCSVCGGEFLYPDEFVSKGAQCKTCKRVQVLARQETEPPETKERRRTYYRTEKRIARTQEYYTETKDAFRERGRAWREAHPLDAQERYLKRKAIKHGAIVGDVDYNRILERDGHVCYICGGVIDLSVPTKTTAGLTFDHIVPLTPRPGEPQGSHTEDNIKPAHHACNVRKKNIPLELLGSHLRRGV